MKTINNMNTLNALIRDETMASKEYRMLAMDKNVPDYMKKTLMKMSADEAGHRDHLIYYREKLKLQKVR